MMKNKFEPIPDQQKKMDLKAHILWIRKMVKKNRYMICVRI